MICMEDGVMCSGGCSRGAACGCTSDDLSALISVDKRWGDPQPTTVDLMGAPPYFRFRTDGRTR